MLTLVWSPTGGDHTKKYGPGSLGPVRTLNDRPKERAGRETDGTSGNLKKNHSRTSPRPIDVAAH